MVNVKPIRTEADYREALARVYELMTNLSPPEGQIEDLDHPSRIELDVLAPMVLEYEDEHYPIDPPTDPIGSIEFCMDQQNLTLEDLAPYFGSIEKARKIMARKEDITMPIARALHKHLGISAETLLHPVVHEFDGGSDSPPKA